MGKLARSLREKMLFKSDDLRHVCNGVLGKLGQAGREQDVSWGSSPSKVARERDAHHSGDAASV